MVFLIFSIILNPSITGNVTGLRGTLELWYFVPFLAYMFFVLIFSFYDSINNKDLRSILLLIPIYPTIHLSYGVGMIYGYWRKLG